MSEPKLEITRFLKAPVQAVFDAWSQPAMMSQWFFVGPGWSGESTNDLRVGGAYEVVMHTPEGEDHVMTGEYREVQPPTRLVFTWSSQVVQNSVVTLDMREVDGGTELKLVHEFLVNDEIRGKHEAGWGGCFAHLEEFLAEAVSAQLLAMASTTS